MSSGVPFRFERAPGLPGSDAASRVFLGLGRPLTRALWKLSITGAENVPTEGPAIICPNHLSFCDSVFVPASLPRRSWAIGKAEYMDSISTKYLFPALGMIPVDRSGLTREMVDNFHGAVTQSAGKVLAYCRSGQRSSMLWQACGSP